MHPILKKVRFLLIPLFLAGLFGCPEPSTEWVRESVSTAEDGAEDVGMNSSLVVDAAGRVHIAYRDSDGWVRYVRREADGVWSGWSYTDPTDATSGEGVSIAADNTNVYVTSTLSGDVYSSSGDLILASRALDAEVPDDNLWPEGVVVNVDDVDDWSSLVAGGDGTLHLLYKDGGSLRYRQRSAGATSFGSASTIESYVWFVVGATAIDGQGSLVVANEKAHVVYKTRTALIDGSLSESIKYASRNSDGSGSWEKKTVASGTEEFGDRMDIAVDSLGGVHIGFVNKTDDRMVYARRLAGEPSFSLYEGGPDPSGWDLVDGCQILITDNTVHVFFRADVDPGTTADVQPFLMRASRDVDAGMTSSWVMGFIDSGAGVFGAEQKTFSAASDSFNRIHVAYETCGDPGCTDSGLKYACAAMADTACSLPEASIPLPECDSDGVCDAGETTENCPADCAPAGSVCGDGVCAGDEGAACPVDCDAAGATGAVCGDAACDPGEDSTTCMLDCNSEGGSTDAATDDVTTEQDNGSSASGDSPVPSGDIGSAGDSDASTGWSAEGVTVEAVGGGGCSLIPR